jgi:hypothetical protein
MECEGNVTLLLEIRDLEEIQERCTRSFFLFVQAEDLRYVCVLQVSSYRHADQRIYVLLGSERSQHLLGLVVEIVVVDWRMEATTATME